MNLNYVTKFGVQKNIVSAWLVLAAFAPGTLSAASATWTGGGSDALWSNTANWNVTPVPGTGNAATFNAAAGTGGAVIDLGAGVIISNLLFDTTAAAYTIGAGAAGSQSLTLNSNGTIWATSALGNSQQFNAAIILGTDATARSYAITNGSASSLTFAGNLSGGSGGTAGIENLTVNNNTNGNIVISGAIMNGGATAVTLTKKGAGSLTLAGTNTYSGITTNSGGTLVINNNLSVSTNLLVLAGGILSDSVSSTLTNNINLSAASTVSVASGQTLTLNGVITNSGALTLTNANGTLVLGGANTFSGAINMTTNTTLVVTNTRGLGNTPNVNWGIYNAASGFGSVLTLRTPSTLLKGDGTAFAATIGLNTYINVAGNYTINVDYSAAGGTAFNQQLAGLNLGGAGDNGMPVLYVYGTNITSGTGVVTFTNLTWGNTGNGGSSSQIVPVNESIVINGPAYPIVNSYGHACTETLFLDGTSTGNAINGVITNNYYAAGSDYMTAAITKQNSSTWTLSGTNSYWGATTVSGGALLINGNNSAATNTVTVASGATLGGSGTIGGLVSVAANGFLSPSLGTGGSSTLTLSSSATNALTLNGGSGNLTFAISTNATALTNDQIQITGTLVLKGSNTIALAFPAGAAPAGTYTLMTYAATTGSGTLTLSGSYQNTTLVVTSTNVQLILSSSNNGWLTWKGQTNGIWDATTTNWISGSSPVNYIDGAQVNFDDTAVLFSVTNNGVSPAAMTVNNNLQNFTFTSRSGGITGATGLIKSGVGTLTLNGTNSFTGDTVINGGSVLVNNSAALAGSSVALNVASALGFNVNAVTLGNLAGSANLALNNGAFPVSLTLGGNNASSTYTGNLTGTGSLIKTGTGVFTLTGTNAIGGTTTVSNGTLLVSGSLTSSAVNVLGGTFAGACTAGGLVTVGTGATLQPGATNGGTLLLNSTLNLNAGSATVMQLGTAASMIRGVSSLTYGGTLVITNASGATLSAGSTFKLFDAATYSGAFTSSNLPALGAGLSWYLLDLTNCGAIRVVPARSVAAVFNNNMVLQRGLPVPVWGTANPSQSVSVNFGSQTKTTTAGADRKWLARLDTMAANTNAQTLTITITGSVTNVYTNVLVGDVWLASGQSNMQFPMNNGQVITNAAAEIAAANYPLIRSMEVSLTAAPAPVFDATLASTWTACSPATVSSWSAVAYFFARSVFQSNNVPIGILQSYFGGTPAEAWTSLAALNAVPELQTLANQEIANYYQVRPQGSLTAGDLFNAMISPLIPFGIRGAIWYQGENNASQGQQYRALLPTLIQDWRSRWQQADFPFYIVQLCSYADTNWPSLREAQLLTLQTVTNTGLAVTIDVGDDPSQIHPTDKQDVGARLAAWALNRNYGFTNVVPSGPLFRTYAIEGSRIRLYFDYAESGLMTGQKNSIAPLQELVGVAPLWFEIAGTNQTYYPATASIDTNNTVVVSSPSVPNPTLARYAWSASPAGTNLYNRAGLPASPFRIPVWTNSLPVASLHLNASNIQSACFVPTNVTWWVEFNDSLVGKSWTPLVLPQTGTGSVQTVTAPINGRAQRFYRWRQLQ